MGQGLSCRGSHDHGLFTAVHQGNLQIVTTLLEEDPTLLHQTTLYDRYSPLHIAAANGQIEVPSSFSFFSIKPLFFSLQFSLSAAFNLSRFNSTIGHSLVGLHISLLFCCRFCQGF